MPTIDIVGHEPEPSAHDPRNDGKSADEQHFFNEMLFPSIDGSNRWINRQSFDHWINDRIIVCWWNRSMNKERFQKTGWFLLLVIYFFFGPNETNVGSKVNEINM